MLLYLLTSVLQA